MRLRLASTLGNRDETTDKDERILNGLVDGQEGRRKEDKANVVKRPGLVSRYTLGTGLAGATIGQCLFSFTVPGGSTTLIGIRGDVLTIPVT